MDADVLVIGLGPVGQLASLLLAREGARVVAVDRAAGPYALPRAAATDDEVLRILQGAGIRLGGLVEDPDVELVSASGRPLPVIAPRARPYGHPPLAFLHQAELETALCGALAAGTTASVRWRTAVLGVTQDAHGVTARVGDGVLRARWALACDGARSAVRAACGIRFAGRTAAQPWVVIDADVRAPVGGRPRAQFVGDPRRPAVNLPLGARHHRWEFLVRPGEDPAELCAPERVSKLISPWVDPATVEVRRAVVYTYAARAAARWRAGRILLLGDAAHVMPPFAGQGMSSGLRDAANVAWKLAVVLRGEAAAALLDTYEAERRPHVAAITRLALAWGAVVQTRRPRVAAGRDAVVGVAHRIPGLRAAVEGYHVKPAPAYRSGAFSGARGGVARRRAGGRLFPQPEVRLDGRDTLLDDALGPGWAVLGIGRDPRAAMSAEARACWRRLGATWAAVDAAGGPGVVAIDDASGALAAWARRYRADVVVLRPDRVVFAAGRSGFEADAAAAAWRRWTAGG